MQARELTLIFIIFTLGVTPAYAYTGSIQVQESHSAEIAQSDVIIVFQNQSVVDPSVVRSTGGNVTGGTAIDTAPVLFATVPTTSRSPIEQYPNIAVVLDDRSIEATAPRIRYKMVQNQTIPWGVDQINATRPAKALANRTNTTIDVAVIDTGIDYQHEDLNQTITWGVSTVGNESIKFGREAADDTDGHGTHVAGTIAAQDNHYGVSGVAPSVELYAVQVLNETGEGRLSDLLQGIDHALKGPDDTLNTSDDADILSLSLGTQNDSQALNVAISNATDRAIVVAAVGNGGDGDPATDDVVYPARYDSVIGVGATNQSDEIPTWSSDGSAVELAAPGVNILSTTPDDSYSYSSGTSMATPHVSGTIALMLANDRRYDNQTQTTDTELIRRQLHTTSIDIGPNGTDRYAGYGLIQTDRAVRNEIQLGLSANLTQIRVNKPVQFTIARVDTHQPVTGRLQINDSIVSTDPNGTVTYRFTHSGTYTATAIKSPTVLETYRNTSVTIVVTDESLAGSYDANANHKLDLREIQRAIKDWMDGDLTLREIQSLISIWATGTKI